MNALLIVIGIALLVVSIEGQPIFAESISDCTEEIIYANQEVVYSISEDLRHPGLVILTGNTKVITTDWVTTHVIAGGDSQDYQEGVGAMAAFSNLFDLVQPSVESVIVSDHDNHCLRHIDRRTNQTSTYAGNCTALGYINGVADAAMFYWPAGLILDEQTLFICDYGNGELRSMNITTRLVSSVMTVSNIAYMALNEGGFFLVSKAWIGMALVNLMANNQTELTSYGENYTDLTSYGENYTDGPFRTAQITQPRHIVWLNKNIALIADSGNSAIRMVNLETEYVFTMCAEMVNVPVSIFILNGSVLSGGAYGFISKIALINVPKISASSFALIDGQPITFTCTGFGAAPLNLRFTLDEAIANFGISTNAPDDGAMERSVRWTVNITASMHGKELTCEVYDHPSGRTLSTTKHLSVYFGPLAESEDAQLNINVASNNYNSKLDCSGMASNPPANFSWFNGHNVTGTGLPISTQRIFNLSLADLKVEPGQTKTLQFLCRAHNAMTERFAQMLFTVNITNVCSGLDEPMWITSNGACVDCNCSSLSSGPNCDIKTGQCPCVNLYGNPLKAGLKCFWYVNSVEPTFGPVAGGTKITVKGGYMFNMDVSSTLPNASFVMTARNETFLELESPMTTEEHLSATVQLTATMSGNSAFIGPEITFKFLYLPNPEVVDIRPRHTIISGGLPITVTGKNLNSVAKPKLLIHLRNQTSIVRTFASSCVSRTSEMMICLSPDVKKAFSTELAASKSNTRAERSVASSEKPSLDEIMKSLYYIFTIGLGFDGLNKLKDLQTADEAHLREVAAIILSLDPEVIEFEEDSNVKIYTPGDIVEVRGYRLIEAVNDTSLFFITVGSDGVCEVTALLDNQLKCKPPNNRPNIDMNHYKNFRGRDVVHVVVKLGNVNWQVGYLLYQQSLWEDPQFRGGIIALVVLVSLIVILVPLVLMIRRRLYQRSQPVPPKKMLMKKINVSNPTYQDES